MLESRQRSVASPDVTPESIDANVELTHQVLEVSCSVAVFAWQWDWQDKGLVERGRAVNLDPPAIPAAPQLPGRIRCCRGDGAGHGIAQTEDLAVRESHNKGGHLRAERTARNNSASKSDTCGWFVKTLGLAPPP